MIANRFLNFCHRGGRPTAGGDKWHIVRFCGRISRGPIIYSTGPRGYYPGSKVSPVGQAFEPDGASQSGSKA